MYQTLINNYKDFDPKKYSYLDNKTILVTGASGLIGMNIVALLQYLKQYYSINIICCLNSRPSYETQELYKGCVVFYGDLTQISIIDSIGTYFIERLDGADLIFHTAGYAQPQKFMTNKISTILLNTNTIINLFKLLNRKGTFFYCSSSEIYSGLDHENISETQIGNSTTEHPRACYIESKRCGETICMSMSDLFNIKIGRISTTYGPGTKISDSRVISSLINQGIESNNIKLLDDGSANRTLCYIGDLIEMIFDTLKGKETIYNLTGQSKISIKNLAEIIANNLQANIILGDKSNTLQGNPNSVDISIQRYMNEFNKSYFINIEEGIKKTIQWHKLIKGKS